MRYRLDIAYEGAAFFGWAKQPGLRTVQAVLEEWIAKVLRLKEPVQLVCAGRTDAGVHARGQVAHLDLAEVDVATLQRRLARVLPADVVVWSVAAVPAEFDARFSALWRRYCYRLTDRPLDPLLRNQVATVRGPLDLGLLNEAGRRLCGLHDFAAFCKSRPQASTIRILKDVSAIRRDDRSQIVEINVRADAFCHSMVRSLVGALWAISTRRRPLEWVGELLTTEQRPSTIQVFPAHGLVLEEVGYPPPQLLAARGAQARRMRVATEIDGDRR